MKRHRGRGIPGLVAGMALVLWAVPGFGAKTVNAKRVNVDKKLIVGGPATGVAKFRNKSGDVSILIHAGTSNVTQNQVDPANLSRGNGLISAWARVDDNGVVSACWRCDLVKTTEIVDGDYRVCFGPLAPDIRGRPVLATIQNEIGETDPDKSPGGIAVAEDATNFDCLSVETFDPDGDTLEGEDFTVAIF